MNRNTTRIWAADDGRLVFEITFDRAWRPGDIDPPAMASIRSTYLPAERREVAIHRHRPTRFELDFSSGHRVRGTLQQRVDVHIDGVTA